MEPGRIFENPAQRSLAKLNSFWGKFDERLDKLAVTSLSSLHELYQYLNESLLEIHGIRVFNNGIDGTRVFSHCPRFTQGQEDQHFQSPFYRCTSSLKLNDHLDRLDDRVLYHDTDSMFYKWRLGQDDVESKII